jgi:hypothetical protein
MASKQPEERPPERPAIPDGQAFTGCARPIQSLAWPLRLPPTLPTRPLPGHQQPWKGPLSHYSVTQATPMPGSNPANQRTLSKPHPPPPCSCSSFTLTIHAPSARNQGCRTNLGKAREASPKKSLQIVPTTTSRGGGVGSPRLSILPAILRVYTASFLTFISPTLLTRLHLARLSRPEAPLYTTIGQYPAFRSVTGACAIRQSGLSPTNHTGSATSTESHHSRPHTSRPTIFEASMYWTFQ